jgi:hypothetical protein
VFVGGPVQRPAPPQPAEGRQQRLRLAVVHLEDDRLGTTLLLPQLLLLLLLLLLLGLPILLLVSGRWGFISAPEVLPA